MIILGDAGINYYLDNRDYILKEKLKELHEKILIPQENFI